MFRGDLYGLDDVEGEDWRGVNMSAAGGLVRAKSRGTRVLLSNGRFNVTSFDYILSRTVDPHTLVLGTMPSITSHGRKQYYGHPNNCFWWIVGDALGFRRGGDMAEEWPHHFGTNTNGSFKKVAKPILDGLLVGPKDPVISYADQVTRLTNAGYALWDVMHSADIKNSDDTSLKSGVGNDIATFLKRHKKINRVVFASGKTSFELFLKTCKHASSQPVASPNAGLLQADGFRWEMEGPWRYPHSSERALDTALHKRFARAVEGNRNDPSDRCITLIIPPSVSPAFSAWTYAMKRDEWLKQVFVTGERKKRAGTTDSAVIKRQKR